MTSYPALALKSRYSSQISYASLKMMQFDVYPVKNSFPGILEEF